MSEEVWVNIPEITGVDYAISNHGRVARAGRILATPPDGTGYPQVNLHIDGQRHHWKVHELVLLAFEGPRPDSMEARHKNGIKTDNRWPENLCWGTKPENEDDKIEHGTSNRGERHGHHELTESDVLEIRRRYAQGERVTELARSFGRSRQCIGHVVHHRRWVWLSDNLSSVSTIREEMAKI